MDYAEKIRLIRKAENLTQTQFCELTGIPISTLKKFEAGFSEVGLATVEKVTNNQSLCKYTLWLMNGTTAPEAGQISPEIEEKRGLRA